MPLFHRNRLQSLHLINNVIKPEEDLRNTIRERENDSGKDISQTANENISESSDNRKEMVDKFFLPFRQIFLMK